MNREPQYWYGFQQHYAFDLYYYYFIITISYFAVKCEIFDNFFNKVKIYKVTCNTLYYVLDKRVAVFM